MKRKILLLLLVLMAGKLTFAQNEDVPVRNIFEGSEKEDIFMLKYSMFRLLRGEIPVYVEKNITNQVSALGGLGLTFPDLIGTLLINESIRSKGIFPTETHDDVLNWFSFGLTGQINYFWKKGDLMDGSSVGLLLGYRNHRGLQLGQNYTIVNSGDVKNPKVNVIELGLTYSFQRIIQQRAVHEIVFGLGGRMHRFDYLQDYGNFVYRWEKGNYFEPTIFLNYRFGSAVIR